MKTSHHINNTHNFYKLLLLFSPATFSVILILSSVHTGVLMLVQLV